MRAVLCLIALTVAITPAYGIEGSGFKQNIQINTGGYDFTVETLSNFDIARHEFDADSKQLTLYIDSRVQNNLSEIAIPANLIGGNFTFYLNGEQIFPKVLASEKVTFMVAEFEGDGAHKLEIIGTTYLPEFAVAVLVMAAAIGAILALSRGPGAPLLKQ